MKYWENKMELKIDNELKNLIPPLAEEEYKTLEQNIIKDGCRDAIVVWNGTIIDGHNRYNICTKNNITFKTKEMDFKTKDDAILWMIENQKGRRNLPKYALVVLESKKSSILELKEKAKENQNKGKANLKNQEIERGSVFPTLEKPRDAINTTKEIAKNTQSSNGTVGKVQHLEKKFEEEPQKYEKLRSDLMAGTETINNAYQTVRREEKKEEVKKKIDNYAKERTGIIDLNTITKKYNIIYADPAWQYWESGNKNQSLHYTTMTIDEICALPVKNIADKDCILFLWVTYPILQEAFKVIEAWGFKYSTCGFVWVKKNKNKDSAFIGCGAWTRANSELCLIGIKGNITRLDASVSQVIEAPIEEHSKKPAETRERIEQLVGKLPRIELFSRTKTEGWDVWGNEC